MTKRRALIEDGLHKAAVKLGSKGGEKGGPARAKDLSPQRRSQIAAEGGRARQRKA